jgi:dihydrofolate synthase / folylpolyglutamate synthase
VNLAKVEEELLGRWPETRIEPSRDRISALVDLLGHPERSYPVIHLTGTNGKSSTARMIDALIRARGLRVGRYTSPHLETMRERISIDGDPVDPDTFVALYEDIRPYVDMVDQTQPVPMSFFEVMTGMAFAAFADAPVDVAVLEVGLGGVWDATNVADGSVAVITPIALDHTHLLGSSVESIAEEKAGIIKPEATLVMAQQQVPVAEILLRRAAEVGASVAREGLEFGVLDREVAVGGQQLTLRGLLGDYDELFLPLFGAHQATNAACALAATDAFFSGQHELDPELVQTAFATVDSPGRLEPVRQSPTVIIDAAHNPAGMAASIDAVQESFAFTRLIGVVAISRDKDAHNILGALEAILAEIVITQHSSARSTPADELAATAVEIFGTDRVLVEPRLDNAIDEGIRLAEETHEFGGSGVLVTGSIIIAGDARRLLGGR